MPGEDDINLQDDSHQFDGADQTPSPAESSSEADPAGQTGDTEQQGEGAAGSGKSDPAATAPPKKGREARFESVMSMLRGKKTDKAATAAPPAARTGDAATGDTAGGDAGKKDSNGQPAAEAAGKNAVPPEVANHPAFKEMQTELQAVREMATKHSDLQTHLRENGVLPENASRSIDLAVLAAKNPEAFYSEICKIKDEYAQFLGKELPADLQEDVDSGAITEARAREISKSRIDKQLLERKSRVSDEQINEQRENASRTATENIVNRFFAEAEKRDPNLKNKIEAIHGEVLRIKALEGAPKNDKAQLDMLKRAHETVNKRMGSQRPLTPTRKSPPASGYAPAAKPAGNTTNDKMANQVEGILNRNRAS